jgi:hypothetical protein
LTKNPIGCLNTLFASAPAQLSLRRFGLPDSSLPVVTGAGMYALGAVTPRGPRTLPALFAAPAAVHRARLIDASNLLAAAPHDPGAGDLHSPSPDTAPGE